MKLDVLAFSAHPDDVELGCSGTLLVEKLAGRKTGIIDLTRGELSTRGTTGEREAEAAAASAVLQLDIRENLGMKDGFFRNDEEHQMQVITIIRKYRPEIIICNAPEDRHPDHGRASSLVSDAAFLAGLRKINTVCEGRDQEHWRPKYVFHYIQDRYLQPNFVIDISKVVEAKKKAIQCFVSQFHNPGSSEPETYISRPNFLDTIIDRDKMFGKIIGVAYGEGFISKKMIGFPDMNSLIKFTT